MIHAYEYPYLSANISALSSPVNAPYPFLNPTSSALTAISGRKRDLAAAIWIEGTAITT